MVADGEKPATWQQIASDKWTEGNKETRITHERWKELNNIFEKLGLASVIRTRLDDSTFVQPKDGSHQWIELADIFLARDQKHAEKLAEAAASYHHAQIGRLLGFPSSAIKAFTTKDTLPIAEWPLSTKAVNENAMKFLNHMVSKNNWEEEISYLPAFSKRVKELSSKIYHDRLDEF